MIKKAYSKTIFMILLVAAFVTVGGGNLVISKPGFEVEEPAKPEVIQKSPTGKDTRSVLLDKGDGVYRFMSTSTDAAGNTSATHILEVELDTKAPETPVVGEAYVCGSAICADIKGEEGAYLVVNGSNKLVRVGDEFNRYILKNGFNFATTYTFEIGLEDRAKNRSENVLRRITTPDLESGQGGIEGTSSENPWAGLDRQIFEPVKFKTIINPDGSYQISNLVLPAPKLTYIDTNYRGEVMVYGVAIPKNYEALTDIEKRFMTYNEAIELCDKGLPILSPNEAKCMEEKMHISDFRTWHIGIIKKCELNPFCVDHKRQHERIIGRFSSHKLSVQHVMVSFNKNDSTEAYLGNLWNDDPSGKFTKVFNIEQEVNIGDAVKARVNIFGEFKIGDTLVDYRGTTHSKAFENRGLKSNWSNILTIEKSHFINFKGFEAKILPVPFINQWLEPDNKTHFPEDGWQMCGAASATVVAGYYNKLSYDKSREHDIKRYMYSDQGLSLGNPCSDKNKAGTFAITNNNCNENSPSGIVKYLKMRGLNATLKNKKPTFEEIKQEVDKGNPVIYRYGDKYDASFGHIIVAVGYTTKDKKIIVNDSYSDLHKYGRGWRQYETGKLALYDIGSTRWNATYSILISK